MIGAPGPIGAIGVIGAIGSLGAFALVPQSQATRPRELAPVARAASDGPGRVVLLGAAFELDAATARELAGDREVVRLLVGGAEADGIDALAQSGGVRTTLAIDPADPQAGDAPAAAQRVRTAACIELAGGAYLDWFHLLTPGGAPSRLGLALREAHAAGAVVLASGSSAPFLGEWAVLDRRLALRPQRNPRDATGRWFIEGLGLLRGVLIDSSHVEDGSPDRVVRSAFHAHLELGLYLDGEVGWIADARGDARVVGHGGVLLFDLARARRLRSTLREGRLALLGDGDRWHARSRTVPSATEPIRCPGAPAESLRAVVSVLDAGFLRRLLLSSSPCGRFADPLRELAIGSDEASFGAPPRAGAAPARVGLRFDLEWLDSDAHATAGAPK